ncbi:hypothetical protein SUGI_0850960 [Cryptomeria japonica]|nr:hypothetical protein SUGI_0850960 [Cryptomeria japonica]
MDWKAAAYGNAVYKLCNNIECNDGTVAVNGLLKELESSSAHIINECLEKSQYLLLLNSKKWARNSDEKMTGKALYTVGKARRIMNKLDIEGKRITEELTESAIVPIE